MKEKKHIDRLFQEGFKDFEATPSDAVWQNIEAKLNPNKKKRRIVPIWWRYAGVAALLAILLTIGNLYFNNTDTIQTNKIVDSEAPLNNLSNDANNNVLNETSIAKDINAENEISNKVLPKNSEVVSNDTNPSDETSTNETAISKNVNESNQQAYSSSNKIPELSNTTLKTEASIVSNPEEKNNNLIQKNETSSPKLIIPELINGSAKNNTPVLAIENPKEDNPILNTSNKENSIEDAIAKTVKDDEENYLTRWTIATNAAPVYFNSLGKGSSLDAQFIDNSKNGEVTISYGVSASYSINKKLSIRSGINKVNLGYNTNNVVVFETVGARSSLNSLKNVNTGNNTTADISVISGESLDVNSALVRTSETSINQSFGYIEIPLEIEYAIINKKFGFNVIGGFSSFILNNNELFSEFEGRQTRIGEATNLNKVSYSANFGLGLNYKLTKKLDLNLEPLFKYQINTFNNTSGDFKPYFIGVYTGIGFKF